MAEFPSMPLFTDAYLSDTHPELTLEQHGCYLVLMMTQWRRPGDSLPDDDKWFCKLLGIHGNKWKVLRESVLERFFRQDDDGNWYQKRLRKERDFLMKSKRKRSESGKKGNDVRWKNNDIYNRNEIAPTPTPTPTESEYDATSEPRDTNSENDTKLSSAEADRAGNGGPKFHRWERLRKKGKSKDYPVEFEHFWKIFPSRKTDSPKKAYLAWLKPANDQSVGPRELYRAAKRYRHHIEQTGDQPQLVSTWVSGEGWTAEACQEPADLFSSANGANGHGNGSVVTYPANQQHRPAVGPTAGSGVVAAAARYMARRQQP